MNKKDQSLQTVFKPTPSQYVSKNRIIILESDVIRCCKTLDALQAELSTQGYTISRSGLYLRLLPKRANTEEDKRHVATVPVKLCKPDSTLHSKHKDENFVQLLYEISNLWLQF